MLRLDRIECGCTKLDRLLHDKVHLLALEECLHENDLCGCRHFGCQILQQMKAHGIAVNPADTHAGSAPLTICNDDLVFDLRAHNAREMVRITARDLDLLRELPRIKQASHQSSNSELRRIIIAAHSFSQVISSTV